MSSIIGHSLAGVTIGLGSKTPSFLKTAQGKILWIGWLVTVAIAFLFFLLTIPNENKGTPIIGMSVAKLCKIAIVS